MHDNNYYINNLKIYNIMKLELWYFNLTDFIYILEL